MMRNSLILAIVIGGTIVMGIVVALLAAFLHDFSGQRGNQLPQSFQYDLAEYQKIDPSLIRYRQVAEIPLKLEEPRGVAVGADDRIYVAGDKVVIIFDSQRKEIGRIDLAEPPRCLAVGGPEHAAPGRIYVGMTDHLTVFNAADAPPQTWQSRGPKAVLTSIAAADRDVFVADAGNRIVWHYDAGGKLLGRIGARDPDRNIPGFVVPSPYFDVAVAPDGLLRAVNPGRLRVEAYTFDGHLELTWGKPGVALERFCGCCNPAALAILPDGRHVTGEKGIPRVKVYSPQGEFEGVVVGPEVLSPTAAAATETRRQHRLAPVDLAVDRGGRILVLDPAARRVRIFIPK